VQVLGGCIFMTKRGAGSVVRFNIDTGEREHYRFRIFRPCGIAINLTDLNVYVACHGSHQIIKFNWRLRKKK
jgi:DNA-binding beta-propeller fold protein YncE